MLWIARRDRQTIEHESVGSTTLPAEFKLSSERGKIMRELGFAKRSGRRNWKREQPRTRAPDELADEALDLLTRIYGVDADRHPAQVALHHDERVHPQNPDLVTAMRRVSKGWDEAVRRAMYTEMLNATFLVPVAYEQHSDAEGSEVFVGIETHQSGRPILGVFSDWAALRLWSPRGHEYWPIHGSELFEMALERQPVSMRINPNGDVGGELYAHELEMLVRAVQTFRRRQN